MAPLEGEFIKPRDPPIDDESDSAMRYCADELWSVELLMP
jgi:hypothetical protein